MDEAVKTRIRFVAGFDGAYRTPPPVRKAGLTHRFAVIQDTSRPDCDDMYFDEALAFCVGAFASKFRPGEKIELRLRMRRNVPKTGRPDPELTEVRQDGQLVLVIAPELWANVGGPAPYHDSYTYSFYSNEDVSGRVIAHLRDSDDAHLWMLEDEVMPAEPGKTTALGRLWNYL